MQPGTVKKVIETDKPKVSVIIPTLKSEAELSPLLDDIRRQTEKSVEAILVHRVAPSGRARNKGVAAAAGDYFFFMDDDIRLGNSEVIATLVKTLADDSTIGLAGTAALLPPDASRFQKRAGREVLRMMCPVVDEVVDSDMATTQCWAQRRDNFIDVGPFSEALERGVDPEYRRRVREHGYRVVLAPNAWHYHPPPKNLRAFYRMYFRNGLSSARAQRFHPELVAPVPETGDISEAVEKPLFIRVLKGMWRLLSGVLTFRFLQVLERISYAYGYIVGRMERRK